MILIAKDTCATKKADAINLSPAMSTLTAIVCKNTSLVDSMKALSSYAKSLRLAYGIHSEDIKTKDVLKNIIFSDYLSKKTWNM